MLRMTLLIVALATFGLPLASAEEGVVTVGVYDNAPKVFQDDFGTPKGIFIDIIDYIAREEGWRLRYVPGTWTEGLDRLAKGQLDLMPDVAITAERETLYAFHKVPVLSSWSEVYASKGSGIQSILDLNAKRIAVLEGSVQQQAFERLAESFGINITLITAPDLNAVFTMVAKKQADAAITNHFFGLMHAKQFGLENTAVLFSPAKLMFAAPGRAQQPLLDTIDAHLLNLKRDPQSIYYGTLKRWASEDVHFNLPTWFKIGGLVLGIALIVSLAGSVVLEHRVKARTHELNQLNQEMEERIIARTAELAAATEKAQAADRIKSAFLATMSHELRTPLNSIIGFTGILLKGLAGPLNDEQHKQMGMVQSSAHHLLALINDVLDISKIEAGQVTLLQTSFALSDAIEKTVKTVAPMAAQKGIDLKLAIGEGVAEITTDRRRLEQILLNLCNNAVKFTETGQVRIDCHGEADVYLIAVTDTGIGIPPQEIPNLFQSFHQIDTGLTRKYEGTGLGLSICKKLVDMMGGTIEVDSQPGRGSTFTLRLPRASNH